MLLLLTLLLVFRGTGMGVITILVGFLYPLHMSLKTIENCTGLFEQITGDQRANHTEEEIKEKRAEIIGQLRTWSRNKPQEQTIVDTRHEHGHLSAVRAVLCAYCALISALPPPALVFLCSCCRLVYWVVYGLFSTLETLSDTALSWLPVYHPVKLMFLLWCFLPRYQGSLIVFDILVRPVLIRHESAIEYGVNTAQQAALFGVGRVGRVVRAKSIQLTQAIQSATHSAHNRANARDARGLSVGRVISHPLALAAVVCAAAWLLSKTGLDMMSSSASAPPLADLPEGERVRHRVAFIESRSPLADIHEQPSASASPSPSSSSRPSWAHASGGEGEQYLPADEGLQQEGMLNNAFAAASKVAEARQRT